MGKKKHKTQPPNPRAPGLKGIIVRRSAERAVALGSLLGLPMLEDQTWAKALSGKDGCLFVVFLLPFFASFFAAQGGPGG